MKGRWLVVFAGIPLLLVVLLLCPPWATALLTAAIAAIAAYELLHVTDAQTELSVYLFSILSAIAHVLCIFYNQTGLLAIIRWMLVTVLFFLAVLHYGKMSPISFKQIAVALIGGMVFPTMYAYLPLLRANEFMGKIYVLFPFAVAFIGDSFSMFGGKWFGNAKFSPYVSPNKTWAGAIAGLIGGALGLMLFGWIGKLTCHYSANYWLLAIVGIVANLFGQLGDLSMSLIKRESGTKDYSHLFLGHGGMLDRFDSTMFILPILYYFINGGLL